jgi:N-acetyl sugar amidotransferase
MICNRCIMDSSDHLIRFNDEGVCNHCQDYAAAAKKELKTPEELEELFSHIKHRRNGEYDSLIGLSGGVDSSYVYHLAKTSDLSPYTFHFDNGWDTEASKHNIKAITSYWGEEAETIKLDLDEFRNIQRAFFTAGVRDIEVPTDHAMRVMTYQIADKHKLHYILSGTNLATESHLTRDWSYGHRDWKYIKSVAKSQGVKIRGFPHNTLIEAVMNYYRYDWVSVLNYIDYNRVAALKTLRDFYGYHDYGGKHQESIITRFVHGYILPRRFGFDSRRSRYSAMICSGQMTREEALDALSKPAYDPAQMEEDKLRFCKEMAFTVNQFEGYLTAPQRYYTDFPSYDKDMKNNPLLATARFGFGLFRKWGR